LFLTLEIYTILRVLKIFKIIIIIFALVLHSQGFKISKCGNICPKWLYDGDSETERVGKAHCIEKLNCHGNALVQERNYYYY